LFIWLKGVIKPNHGPHVVRIACGPEVRLSEKENGVQYNLTKFWLNRTTAVEVDYFQLIIFPDKGYTLSLILLTLTHTT